MILKVIEHGMAGVGVLFLAYKALVSAYHAAIRWAEPEPLIQYNARAGTVWVDGKIYSEELVRELVSIPKGVTFRVLENDSAGYKMERIADERILVLP